MAFSLAPNKSLPHELRRVALEELDAAMKGANAKNIHLVRSRLKRVRALLKLAAIEGDTAAAAHERALSDAARHLSEIRDIEVCLKAVATIKQRRHDSQKKLPAALFVKARQTVGSIEPRAVENAMAEAHQTIAVTRHALSGWLGNIGWKSVPGALEKSYRKGRHALKIARESKENRHNCADPCAMHLLRKRLKTLWLQLRLLCNCWPKGIKELADEAERLSDLLGREHDLVILQERLDRPGGPSSLAPLKEKIAGRRARLDHRCLTLAETFLSEKPGQFAKRIF